jgi:hypothetical protein
MKSPEKIAKAVCDIQPPRQLEIITCIVFLMPFLVITWFMATPALAALCVDRDGDGYVVCSDCDLPSGKSCGECDDSNAAVNPSATEICNGIDDDCDKNIDLADSEFNDPDPFLIDAPPVDDDGDGELDEGFGYCLYASDGPQGECKTGGRLACVWPPGQVTVTNEFGILTCTNASDNIIRYAPETLDNPGSCTNGFDDDCDLLVDVQDPDCQQPERCDYRDNDGDGLADEDFPRKNPGSIGKPCSAGVGICERSGFYVCRRDAEDGQCNAFAGDPKHEGSAYGDTCANKLDDDCDGLTDLADPDCALFGKPELCGNEQDDDGDNVIDEGFPELGDPCAVGVGACQSIGTFICSSDGRGTVCAADSGKPKEESDAAGTCDDFIDNDCDGLTDHRDPDCPAPCTALDSDLGVTCSLPYVRANREWDGNCRGWHRIEFSGGQATEVRADLLALDADGTVLDMIENVQAGDRAILVSNPHLAVWSRQTRRGRSLHLLSAPLPLLRVTGRKGSVQDVAYCSILPYLEVDTPQGVTFAMNEEKEVTVSVSLPLVDVDSLEVRLDGVDIFAALGLVPADVFPTTDACLCDQPGECVFQIKAGCGDDRMVDIEVRNLKVEGLDQNLAANAFEAIGSPDQVNTLRFTVSGLPAGGHKFRVKGQALPFPSPPNPTCLADDLTDSGTVSAFGIDIVSPRPQEVVTSGALFIEGTVCSANEIASFKLNGKPVDVTVPTSQTCRSETEFLTAECSVKFNERMPQHSLLEAVSVSAPQGSFLRGSNRIIADAIDIRGGRTFNTDTIFALGSVQKPAGGKAIQLKSTLMSVDQALMSGSRDAGLDRLDALRAEFPDRIQQFLAEEIRPTLVDTLKDLQAFLEDELKRAMASAEVDPALMAGLDANAATDFFQQACTDAITRFTNDVSANLSGKTFGTIDVKPDCSCDLNNVPLVLESISFVGGNACNVDFRSGEIELTVDFPDVHLQIGAHDSCTTHGLFGECLARTRVNVTARARIVDIDFAYVITEEQIETKTPASDAFEFTWFITDDSGHDLYSTLGTCVGGPDAGKSCFSDKFCGPPAGAGTCASGPDAGKSCSTDGDCARGSRGNRCFGGENQGRSCEVDADCPGGACFSKCVGSCQGAVKNENFAPVVSADTPIECWGAWVCTIFDTAVRGIGVVIAEVFTLGYADTEGWIAGQFGIGEFAFEEDFLSDFGLNKPDAMGLSDIGLDPDKFAGGGVSSGVELTPGPIDVEIEKQGLTVAIPAEFSIACNDPDIDDTPGSALTPARAPTVTEVVNAGGDISLLIADDVFNQVFSGMKQCGDLKSFCITSKGLETIDDLLPADCESLPFPEVQGICHAIRDADCSTLTGLPREKGACHGFKGDDCSALPPAQRNACEGTEPRNLRFDDGILLCAKVDMDPEIGIHQQPAQDGTIGFDIAIKQLSVVFVLDRAGNGYAEDLSDLPGCSSAEGDSAPDCQLYAACLDLALKTQIGLDNSSCSPQELGFTFDVENVLPSNENFGVMCGAPDVSDDLSLLREAFQSIVIDKIAENAEKFAPDFCAEGLTLDGVMELIYNNAKLFGLTTDEVTPGFADYLGITVDLQAP